MFIGRVLIENGSNQDSRTPFSLTDQRAIGRVVVIHWRLLCKYLGDQPSEAAFLVTLLLKNIAI